MAYFPRKPAEESGYTRQFASPTQEEEWDGEEPLYDDGFDEMMEDEDPEDDLSREELREERRHRFRLAAGFGNLGATLIGVVVILALIAFLISMIQFLSTDITQNYSLFQTKF